MQLEFSNFANDNGQRCPWSQQLIESRVNLRNLSNKMWTWTRSFKWRNQHRYDSPNLSLESVSRINTRGIISQTKVEYRRPKPDPKQQLSTNKFLHFALQPKMISMKLEPTIEPRAQKLINDVCSTQTAIFVVFTQRAYSWWLELNIRKLILCCKTCTSLQSTAVLNPQQMIESLNWIVAIVPGWLFASKVPKNCLWRCHASNCLSLMELECPVYSAVLEGCNKFFKCRNEVAPTVNVPGVDTGGKSSTYNSKIWLANLLWPWAIAWVWTRRFAYSHKTQLPQSADALWNDDQNLWQNGCHWNWVCLLQ